MEKSIYEKIIIVYCIVDDFIKNVLGIEEQANNKRKVSDSQIITIGIISSLYYYGNVNLANESIISMNVFTESIQLSGILKRLKNCFIILEKLLRIFFSIAKESDDKRTTLTHTNDYDCDKLCVTKKFTIIDSMPVPMCNIVRKNKCKSIDKEDINDYVGYCASKKLFYIGLKLTIVCNSQGLPVDYCIMKANKHDIKAFEQFDLDVDDSVLLADKGYLSEDLEQYLLDEKNCVLKTPKRKNMKTKNFFDYKLLKVNRKRIETTFSKLKTNLVGSLKFVKLNTVVLKTKLALISLCFDAFSFI